MTAPALDQFAALDARAITPGHVFDLANDFCAAVRVPGFLHADTCRMAAHALHRVPTTAYDADRVPTPIVRFGPSLNDYRISTGRLDADRYWADAEAAARVWAGLGLRPDPLAGIRAQLAAAWGKPITRATINGRPAYAGTLREMTAGTLIHVDDVTREFPTGLFDQPIVAQLAFNAWAEVPSSGGATTVWNHRWQPADAGHRQDYGFRPQSVTGCPRVTVTPRQGDGLLFNSLNFHAAQPNSSPQDRRIAFACFLGLTATGHLVTWS